MAANEVFIDTACVVALLNETDEHHATATALYKLLRSRSRLITSRAVCFEVGNSFAKTIDRVKAANFLRDIEYMSDVTVLPIEENLYRRALDLFEARPDKGWSLTDCSSFLLMEERGITSALTTDRHFAQAGFIPLMRTSGVEVASM